MDHNRKQVVVCSPNPAFVGALRLVLSDSDFEVFEVETLDQTPNETDALVYQAVEGCDTDGLSVTASRVATLVLADPELLIECVDANCRGFLPGSASLEEVEQAVTTIVNGGAVVPAELLGTVLRHMVNRRRASRSALDLSVLTPREREIFDLAVTGARKDEIGERLFISPDTARTHLQRVYRKLGVHSQAELIALSARRPMTHEGDDR